MFRRRRGAFVPDLPELCGFVDAGDFGTLPRTSGKNSALDGSAFSDGGNYWTPCKVGADDLW